MSRLEYYNRRKIILTAAYILGGFFASRCMLFNILCPLGTAYLAWGLGRGLLYPAALSAIVGVLTRQGDIFVWGYVVAYGLMVVINPIIIRRKSLTHIGRSLISALIMLVGCMVNATGNGFSRWYIILAFLQAAFTALVTLLVGDSMEGYHRGKGDFLGIGLLVGSVWGGMGDVTPGGVPISLAGTVLLLPLLLDYTRMEGDGEGRHIRGRVTVRLENFARSLDRLAFNLQEVGLGENGENQVYKRGRDILKGELTGLSKVLKELAEEINREKHRDIVLSNRLEEQLNRTGIGFRQAMVYRGDGRLQAYIIKDRRGSCDRCLRNVIPAASCCLGVRMRREGDICRVDRDTCVLQLCQERPYRIAVAAGTRTRAGSSVSGDSYTFMELKGGRYMLALSDGMGSGEVAREESAASVELFEDFVEVGFTPQLALEQLNSLLIMEAQGKEIFATLDICTINLYEGCGEIVKIGAMPSYHVGRDGLKIIGGGGLPVGIVDKTYGSYSSVTLTGDDLIVMVTDGVTEAIRGVLDKEAAFGKLVEKYGELPVDKLCEKLLSEVENSTIRDDMTVLAAKIWRVC